MLKKIQHIGIVAKDFEHTIAKFEGFGLICKEIMEIQEIGVKIAFFPIGDTMIEFLTFTQPENESDTLVRSQKGFLNHLCFEVENLDTCIRDFEKNGAKLVEGFPRAGAHGRVAFFYPETTEGVLIEICQL